MLVVGGVDAHADTHDAAALDQRGALLGTQRRSRPPSDGYGELFRWIGSRFGALELVAIESTGCYAAGLGRYLRARAAARRSRSTSLTRTRAVGAARATRSTPRWPRAALAAKATAVPKDTDGIVEAIRQLRVAATAPSRPAPPR